ncbi:MAG: nicotinamide mononucleotide transporter [Erysipelotrichaceae bacterium]|nr:nicotinamide mononucleotide transporter [Erysipelotrichaceae bacterium]
MIKKMKQYLEPNRKIRIGETVILVLLLLTAAFSFLKGLSLVNSDPGEIIFQGTLEMTRDDTEEDYDSDSTMCDVLYVSDDKKLILSYPYEEYLQLEDDPITAYAYVSQNGTELFFDHADPSKEEVQDAYRQVVAEDQMPLFNLANAVAILAISLCVVLFFGAFFSTYEKIWFMTIMILATVFAILFPEESANGVNGIVIMLLYLLDTFLNILCELLISKQSRYNFLVSVLVEITEIVICIVLMYRFATMVTTLFFWLPIDILSYINWTRHRDDREDELTVVRRLKGYQEVLVILGIALWTIVVGYLISGLDIATDFYGGNDSLETAVTYIDACASAVGIANGLFIFFRMREQWIAWYVCALLEAIINIISGQYVLLILKLGYFTNTTYGYIRWSRYIATHKEAEKTLF